jgi:hypothetical protein
MPPKIVRKLQKLFGSTAPSTDIGKFGSLAAGAPATSTDPDIIQSLPNYLQGWKGAVIGGNSPAIEDVNAIDFLFARQLAYIFQNGIPEWDTATEYFINSYVSRNGNIFKSLTDNNISNDPDLSPANWVDVVNDKMKILAVSNWDLVAVPEANPWNDVCFGLNKFVSVAGAGTNRTMVSSDGRTWVANPASQANTWVSVCFNGSNLFVAVSEDGTNRVMTSPDGINWTNRTSISSLWSQVIFANGQYVAVAVSGTNRVMTSPDGINWTARTAANAFSWKSVAFGNSLYVAVADGAAPSPVMTSPDGINWTARTAIAGSWKSICFGNDLFVAVGLSNNCMTSPDGINWTARVISPGSSGGWFKVIFGNSLFVAFSNASPTNSDGPKVVAYSKDGINWKNSTSAPPTGISPTFNGTWSGAAFGQRRYVAVSGPTLATGAIMNSLAIPE